MDLVIIGNGKQIAYIDDVKYVPSRNEKIKFDETFKVLDVTYDYNSGVIRIDSVNYK